MAVADRQLHADLLFNVTSARSGNTMRCDCSDVAFRVGVNFVTWRRDRLLGSPLLLHFSKEGVGRDGGT
jgi:hypothetical protein